MTTLAFDVLWRDHGASRGLKNLGKDAGDTQGKMSKMGAAGGAAGGLLKKMPLLAVAGGVLGVGAAFGKAVDKAAGFDKTMRQVGIQTGQSGKALEDMTDLALKMGKETSFSAQGASDAMLELAKGGMSAADQKAGALQQTLILATAGGLELGAAASYMTQGLNTFGLKAGDAGRVAASLAGAANASTASVEDMGTALSQVGPSAASAGLSIEDTTAALAAFTNNGMKGSDAGTSLKTMLTRLVPQTNQATKAMEDVGLVTADGGNAFFDASGKIKSMTEVAGLLQNALKDQTAEQKITTMHQIFGSDAARAATILSKEGAKGLAKYAEATRDSSAAQMLANEATKGYSGALEKFQGAIETAQIQLGRKFLPILTEVLDYLSGPAMDTFTDIANILEDTFSVQIGAATGGVTKFIQYLSTHQAAVLEMFQNWGNGVFDFAVAISKMAADGLRSIGDFTYKATLSVFEMVGSILKAFDGIPGVDLRDSIANFDSMKKSANDAAWKARGDLYSMADGIDKKVVPAVENMRTKFNKSANTAILTAKQRDAVNAVTNAVGALGTKSDGTQIQVKKFSDITNLAAGEQKAFKGRLSDARTALRDQLTAAEKAGAGQKDLTKTWKEGRAKLYDEFIQMGISKREAGRLADKYAGIKPKVETKVTQPGMTAAKKNAGNLKKAYEDVPKSVNTKVNWDTAVDKINTKLTMQYGKGAKLIEAGGPGHGPLDASVGPPTSAPLGGGTPLGGPSFGAVHRAGTKEVTKHGTGVIADLLKQLSPKMAGDDSGAPGGKPGSQKVGPGWGPVQAAMRRHGATTFNTYPGHHPSMAMARDVYPHNWAAANAARALSSVWYVIYRMKIASKNHGNGWREYRPTNFNGDWRHEKHIHVARRYDQGGILPSGGLGVNRSGRPERVLSPRQTSSFDNLVRVMDQQGGVTVNNHYTVVAPNYVGSQHDLVKALVDIDRRGGLQVLKR